VGAGVLRDLALEGDHPISLSARGVELTLDGLGAEANHLACGMDVLARHPRSRTTEPSQRIAAKGDAL